MKRALLALAACAMLSSAGLADTKGKTKPVPVKPPVEVKVAPKVAAKITEPAKLPKMEAALKSVDLTSLQRAYVEKNGVFYYGIAHMNPVGRMAGTRVSDMNGVIFMPRITSAAKPIWRNGRPAGAAHVSGDHLSFILVAGAGRPIGTMDYRINGEITYSLDLDRDGVVDYAEVLAPGGLTVTVREGLGEDFAAAFDSIGVNAFCGEAAGAKGAGAVKGAGAFRPPTGGTSWLSAPGSDWAAVDLCGASPAGRSAPALGGAGRMSGGGSDPFGAMCSSVGISLSRPPQFSGRNQALTDAEKRQMVLENAIRSGDLRRVTRITTNMANDTLRSIDAAIEGAVGSAADGVVGAVESGTAPAREAASHIIGDVLRTVAEQVDPGSAPPVSVPTDYSATAPSGDDADDTESSGQEDTVSCDDCGRDYYREHGLLGGDDTSMPDPTQLDDGAGTLPFLCRSQQRNRSEWQRVVEDRRGRNYADCTTGPAGEPTNDRGPFCSFMNGALNRVDPLSVAGAGSGDAGTGRGAVDTPESAIQARFAAVQRTGNLTIFTCDPAICQPLPVQ